MLPVSDFYMVPERRFQKSAETRVFSSFATSLRNHILHRTEEILLLLLPRSLWDPRGVPMGSQGMDPWGSWVPMGSQGMDPWGSWVPMGSQGGPYGVPGYGSLGILGPDGVPGYGSLGILGPDGLPGYGSTKYH